YGEVWTRGLNGPDRDPEFTAIHWTTAQNRAVSREEIEKAKRQLPKLYFARDYLGDWTSVGASVYDEFDDSIHVLSEAQARLELKLGSRPWSEAFETVYAGMDFGWTSPGAIVLVGKTKAGDLLAFEEHYAPGRIFLDTSAPGNTWAGIARDIYDRF